MNAERQAPAQRALFDLAPVELEPAPARAEHLALAEKIPTDVRFGTMSWSYPGWAGIVYKADVHKAYLAERGLAAYAKHTLLRAVEIDRTYYEPVSADLLRSFAESVPNDFRFLVKAHQDCTVATFPAHARYGKKRDERNARYLDAAYASDAVIGPIVHGLDMRTAAILFQFSPEERRVPEAFADAVHDFLRRLPKGPTYAVELRNPELLTPAYAAALADAGAIHCHNVWTVMPALFDQARTIPPAARRPLLIRWLLRRNDSYEAAEARGGPFDRIVSEDLPNRMAIANLVAKAHSYGVPSLIFADNKAEGCAPETIARLANAVVERIEAARVPIV